MPMICKMLMGDRIVIEMNVYVRMIRLLHDQDNL